MEAAATVLRLPLRPSTSVSNGSNLIRFASNYRLSKSTSPYHVKLRVGKLSFRNRKALVVRASNSSNSFDSNGPIAPLQLESPVGQFLSQILVSHPHLVPAAVDQQLEQLQTDCEAEKQKEEPSASSSDLVLYRRIAEVKANERRKALEEILYTLVVQKFVDANISLIPSITPSAADPSGRVDVWPSPDGKLKEVHSPEAYEMIQHHLALILGNRLEDSSSVAQISKLRIGQVYAASVMFGYFLKRIDQRFQLEKAIKILPEQIDGRENEVTMENGVHMDVEDSASFHHDQAQLHPEISSWAGGIGPGGFDQGIKPSRLRSYVMAFDAETLTRYATIRSKEAVSIIEKHTEALFGKPEIVMTPQGTIDSSSEEFIKIGFGGLRRLILEAVTFGSFLWDVESYVDSRHRFVLN
ncbi:UV-B-induced protein At3g17800, chloroplastic-like [Chenopodium quinoa]|uniref:UV-B-induced protein n=1 Tax=Chenopodium quinoa TaxID=63459 RepID=A0A803N978_CHEQI|nr:UV-B-induced protein At3g17800, chloroplastic-like [Chenopodium quinoa]XP_021717645.1 UV-B-induced protein At3g17800, chloroplastic-like [Chenopodium quinoa]XP_021717646.1 UV-B-induced protein At3g17800, chloroplastic-like [Chenopodium quinoa]